MLENGRVNPLIWKFFINFLLKIVVFQRFRAICVEFFWLVDLARYGRVNPLLWYLEKCSNSRLNPLVDLTRYPLYIYTKIRSREAKKRKIEST